MFGLKLNQYGTIETLEARCTFDTWVKISII